MAAHKMGSGSYDLHQHVSVDLSHGTSALVDLQDISENTMTVLGIKRVIKASLVIQISHI